MANLNSDIPDALVAASLLFDLQNEAQKSSAKKPSDVPARSETMIMTVQVSARDGHALTRIVETSAAVNAPVRTADIVEYGGGLRVTSGDCGLIANPSGGLPSVERKAASMPGCFYGGSAASGEVYAISRRLMDNAMRQFTAPMALGLICIVQHEQAELAEPNDRILAIIEAELARTSLEDEALAGAKQAISETQAFLGMHSLPDDADVSITDDGVVVLQWRIDDFGLMLLFSGDGVGTYSIKEPGGYYVTGRQDFSLDEPIPESLEDALNRIHNV